MVVPVRRMSLAVGAKVRVVAHGALEADTFNVRLVLLILAKRTIAVDAKVAVDTSWGFSQRFVDGNKAVSRVNVFGALDTLCAEIPVGAVQALVADAVDELLASIADRRVTNIAASIAKEVAQSWHCCVRSCSLEGMTRMMAVLVVNMALHAQVVVITRGACNKHVLALN